MLAGKTIKALMAHLPQTGSVVWIGLRPSKRADLDVVEAVEARTGTGLDGDRYGKLDGDRQVTLIQAEHLTAVGQFLGRAPIDPTLVRRNLVVSGINLLALKNRRFRVGGALLEGTGACHPCSRMEEVLGSGGYNALRGHGGLTARVIEGGTIRLGDAVAIEPTPE